MGDRGDGEDRALDNRRLITGKFDERPLLADLAIEVTFNHYFSVFGHVDVNGFALGDLDGASFEGARNM